MKPDLMQWIAILAPVVMAAAMVGTLLWGVWTYKRSGEAQMQLLALGTLQHYLDLAVTHPDLASRDEKQPVDARYAWFAAQSLTTAQTLWLLVGRQPNWRRSVNAIVRQHCSYLRSGTFVCSDFSPDFVSYLRTRVADLKCAAPDDCE